MHCCAGTYVILAIAQENNMCSYEPRLDTGQDKGGGMSGVRSYAVLAFTFEFIEKALKPSL